MFYLFSKTNKTTQLCKRMNFSTDQSPYDMTK